MLSLLQWYTVPWNKDPPHSQGQYGLNLKKKNNTSNLCLIKKVVLIGDGLISGVILRQCFNIEVQWNLSLRPPEKPIRPPQNSGQFFTVPWVSLIPKFHCILLSETMFQFFFCFRPSYSGWWTTSSRRKYASQATRLTQSTGTIQRCAISNRQRKSDITESAIRRRTRSLTWIFYSRQKRNQRAPLSTRHQHLQLIAGHRNNIVC